MGASVGADAAPPPRSWKRQEGARPGQHRDSRRLVSRTIRGHIPIVLTHPGATAARANHTEGYEELDRVLLRTLRSEIKAVIFQNM